MKEEKPTITKEQAIKYYKLQKHNEILFGEWKGKFVSWQTIEFKKGNEVRYMPTFTYIHLLFNKDMTYFNNLIAVVK